MPSSKVKIHIKKLYIIKETKVSGRKTPLPTLWGVDEHLK